MQRSTGRRQVMFSIMGLRCAEKCHLPQAEHKHAYSYDCQQGLEPLLRSADAVVCLPSLGVQRLAVAGLGVLVLGGTMASMCWAVHG